MSPLATSSQPLLSRRVSKLQTRVGGTPRPFWDCRLDRTELWLLAGVIGSAVLLHLGPVLHSPLGVPLLYLLAVAAYLSPVSGFLFIACGQFLPFPETSPHNPAQVGVLVWLPVVLVRYHRVNLANIGRLWPVLPFLVWFMMLTQESVFSPSSEYMKALFYCVIACQLANEAKGQYLKCLFGLCLGALLVMVAYWAQQIGLPIEVSDWGGEREGYARMGSVRADSVMVWPALLFGVSGLLGIQLAFASKAAPHSSPKWLTHATIILTLATLPPLISTMCNGAIAGLVLVAGAFAGAFWITAQGVAAGDPRFRQLLLWGKIACVGVVLMFLLDAFEVRSRVLALDRFHKQQTQEFGSATASRSGVWRDSLNTIMKYPVFGIRVTGEKEEITSEYAEAGGYLSHNVFLDYGRYVGIPGILLLGFFFFWPAIRMCQAGDFVRFLPFLLAHFAMFIFWMSLSFQFYKTFWALWMLMAMAVIPGAARMRNHPRKSRNRIKAGPTTLITSLTPRPVVSRVPGGPRSAV